MSMDNVQLKQEDVFGEHAVLTDVNPVTNTKSIDDAANGEKLNQTLDRIWESINNKLSRIVNSVNGRTGVVVLTSDDVGLGNVDNVSFADIKSWVINQIENAFENKQLRLYDTYDRVIEAIDANDKTMSWAPFYCDMYGNNDRRAVIGVYTWDPSSAHLGASYRMINTVGYADQSIIYRASQSDYNPGAPGEQDYEKYSDIPVGGIGVNIYKEERPDDQILYLEGARTGVPKGQAGLRLDHDKIGSRLYYEETPYGDVNIPADPDLNWTFTTPGMLWRFTDSQMNQGIPVKILINGVEIQPTYFPSVDLHGDASIGNSFYLSKLWPYHDQIRQNDIIIMRLANFTRTTSAYDADGYNCRTPEAGVCMDFNDRQPVIGHVKKFEETDSVGTVFVIEFHDLRPNTIGYGIATNSTHQDGNMTDTALGIKVLTSRSETPSKVANVNVNMSGLNAQFLANHGTYGSDTHRESARHSVLDVYTPWGKYLSSAKPDGGMAIQTDETLCIQAEYQRKPTAYRLWGTPTWVANKYYKKEGDTYVLMSSKPNFWYSNWSDYYVKTGEDTYAKVVGIPPVYAAQDINTGHGSDLPSRQFNIGSLMSLNYSWTRYDTDTYQERLTAESVEHPKGSDPTDGLCGTISELGINFRKISYLPDEEADDRDGYMLHNMSGLRFFRVSDNHIGTGYDQTYDADFYHEIGIADGKDATGKSVNNVFTKGGATAGIGVNVGRFLEITPAHTYRAETYWNSGKVQVRTAEGLAEKIEMYDVTDYIKRAAVPAEDNVPFDYKELQTRWLTTSNEFFVIDEEEPDTLYPCRVRYLRLEEKPDDWDDEWYKYLRNIGTDNDKDFVFLPVISGVTIGFEPESPVYMGPYYRMSREMVWGDITLEDLRNDWMRYFNNSHRIIWKRPTNRLTIDVDPETLSFDENGKLTVVGGVGKGERSNTRFIDSAGVYADTNTDIYGDEGALPTLTGGSDIHTEYVRLCDGLKLNGAGFTVPIEMFLDSNEINARLQSVIDTGMSAGELCFLIDDEGSRFDIERLPIGLSTPVWFSLQQSALSTKIGSLPYTDARGRHCAAMDVVGFFKVCNRRLHALLSDNTKVVYGDSTYNIPEYGFLKGEVRTYMTGTISEIMTRARKIVHAIRGVVTDPSDANKVEQYVADHYYLGTVTSNEELSEKLENVPLYAWGHEDQDDYMPFDWLFSFFAGIVLNGGWHNIVAGEFHYTLIEHRPDMWTSSYTSYFNYDSGQNVYNALTPTTIEYHPGIFYTRDAGTGEFTIVTEASATQETILQSYYFQNKYTLRTDETAPANWETDYNSYLTTTDETPDKWFSHVDSLSAPTWEANKYYVEDASGSVTGYEKVSAAPAFASSERGTPNNPIPGAPAWAANTFCNESGGAPQSEQPADWYTNYASYYRRLGEEGSYTYEQVTPYMYIAKTYSGGYYSRTLASNS